LSSGNRKEAMFVALIIAMLAIGVILIIYDNFKPGNLFTHATFLSVVGLVFCVAGLILMRKLA